MRRTIVKASRPFGPIVQPIGGPSTQSEAFSMFAGDTVTIEIDFATAPSANGFLYVDQSSLTDGVPSPIVIPTDPIPYGAGDLATYFRITAPNAAEDCQVLLTITDDSSDSATVEVDVMGVSTN